ncbi:hypothetical protein BD309DRAFT_967496 [Dichomitus squalens]|nr:hypothetical protein BD309DRAFT_967496 [Dichomitus squalens]
MLKQKRCTWQCAIKLSKAADQDSIIFIGSHEQTPDVKVCASGRTWSAVCKSKYISIWATAPNFTLTALLTIPPGQAFFWALVGRL